MQATFFKSTKQMELLSRIAIGKIYLKFLLYPWVVHISSHFHIVCTIVYGDFCVVWITFYFILFQFIIVKSLISDLL